MGYFLNTRYYKVIGYFLNMQQKPMGLFKCLLFVPSDRPHLLQLKIRYPNVKALVQKKKLSNYVSVFQVMIGSIIDQLILLYCY